jgi:phage tail-like protein
MADSIDNQKVAYPLPSFNYRVEIDKETVSFSEVSGLTIKIDTTTYKESSTNEGAAGPRVFNIPAQGTPATITLKKGVVRKTSIATLYKWISDVKAGVAVKKDVVVRLCDENGTPVISWTAPNAFPTQLDGPSFSATSNDAAIETLTLMADGVQIAES